MHVKNPTFADAKVIPIRKFDIQLQDLYFRKSAVEELIRSLEDYQRFRSSRLPETANLKTA